MNKIGVLTSGGDSPGMNAAIRGVVRAAKDRGLDVVGFMHGYRGLIADDTLPLDSNSMSGIISRGGTILHTARCMEFMQPEGRRQALDTLESHGIQGLVVIGGDGSLTGAKALHEEFGFKVMGVPGSIDNDISGSDYSIGFDTAVNTAIDAIDRVRDTAYSHDRVFVIEVMGRRNGFIAIEAGLAGGAEAVLIPEVRYDLVGICDNLRAMRQKGKRSSIIIVAEGAARASDIKDFISKNTGFDARYLVLGHMQRGGSPTGADRVLALRLGAYAVQKLLEGASGEMVGIESGNLVTHTLQYVLSSTRTIEEEKLELIRVMAK